MTSKKHIVSFKYTTDKSIRAVVFDSIPNLWNELKTKYEWKMNGKTLRKREDLVYSDEKQENGIPLDKLKFEDTMEKGGLISFKTKEDVRHECIQKHDELLKECVKISTFPKNDERVKVEWKHFIAIFLVRASSDDSRSSHHLPSAKKERSDILCKLQEARDKRTQEIRWTTSLEHAPVYDRKKLEKDITQLPRFLHFIGHGSSYQLHLDSKRGSELDTVNGSYVLELIKSTTSLECVFLNCCNSFELGREIAQYVSYVICWQGRGVKNVTDEGPVSGEYCAELATQFYESIRDQLRHDENRKLELNIRNAFRVAVTKMIDCNGFDVKKWRPRLWCHNGSSVHVSQIGTSTPSRLFCERLAAPPDDLVTKDGGFVDGLREQDLNQVRMKLLGEIKDESKEDDTKENEESHNIVGVYGINGMGGLGKSTLAQQIAQDDMILKKYSKRGVFWLTATKNSLDELNNLIHDLNNFIGNAMREKRSKMETCSTIDSAREMLKRILTETWDERKPILIIVDDLWDENVYLDIVPGREWMPKGSAVLITYRDQRVAECIVNESYALTKLDKDAAVKLLRRSAGVKKTDVLKGEEELVQRVGYHPMAITILAKLMRSRRGETESSMTKVLEGLLKELNRDGVLMSDVKEGAEWVKEWLETLDLTKYFKLLVEIGEYDTKEKILKLTKEQLSDLNEDARDENMKPIRTASRHTLLDAIKEERERDTIRRHDCVHACIKLSVNELSKDEKEMFLRMAVFPEDAIIPIKCLEELWSEETSQKVRADACIHRLVTVLSREPDTIHNPLLES